MVEQPTGSAPQDAGEPEESAGEGGTSRANGVTGVLVRLRDHKVVQWALAYIGAAITIAHGEELLAHGLGWNEGIARWLIALLVVAFPVALILAWYHGHKGFVRASQGELLIGSIMLVIAGLLLVVLVRPPQGAPEAAGAERANSVQEGAALRPEAQTSAAIRGSASESTSLQIPRAVARKPRIAILPFENLSPDPKNAFFANGMHEELLTILSNTSPDLEVISRTTMDSYADQHVTIEKLAQALGCTHVLEGSVRREGNDVRVTMQLINAKDDNHVWAQDYDRKLVSAMALQTEIAREVAAQLSVKLGGLPSSLQSNPPQTNPLAYEVYLKGRVASQGLSALSSLQDWQQALHYYDQVIKIDPAFSKAYVDRIFIRSQLLIHSLDTHDENMSAAEQDLATLRKLAPDDPKTLFAAGLIAYAQIHYENALNLFEMAGQRGYSDQDLLGVQAALLFSMGRFRESEEINRNLAALDPANSTRYFDWWFSLMELRRPQEAIAVANLGVRRWAGSPALSEFWQGLRDSTLFQFSDARFPNQTLPPASADSLGSTDMMRYQNKNEEARAYIDASKAELYHADLYWPVLRGDQIPVADLRGWFDLFMNDRAAASRDAKRVLDFLVKVPEPKWNKWLRAMLRADAALFTGDGNSAIKQIDQAVALAEATEEKSDQTNARMWRAMIYAWAGRTDAASQLLEGFATSVPGLWPGEVVYNPTWNIPLKGNPRYEALRGRLLAQMRATRLQ